MSRFAEQAGYPLLADPLSGARRGPAVIATYDVLLRSPGFTATVAPELVIRVGDLPTSKPLRAWLEALADAEQVSLGSEPAAQSAWQDPAAVLTEMARADPAATLNAWAGGPARRDLSWLDRWRSADTAAAAALTRGLGDELSEPLVARRLGQWLGPEATLFVASSMPIRDVELFFAEGGELPRVLANRGANGIDGTVSSAFGVAATNPGPVVLLIGDVALAHDIGGLLAGTPPGIGADHRAAQQRRRGDLLVLARRRPDRRLRRPHRHPPRARLRPRRQPLRVRLRPRRRRGDPPRSRHAIATAPPGPRSSRCAPTASRTSRCTAGSPPPPWPRSPRASSFLPDVLYLSSGIRN